MAERFYIKEGDTARPVVVTLCDDTGAVQDLTGASVAFSMRLRGTATKKVAAGSCNVASPATGGIVRYDFQATDVDTPGTYEAEFVVTMPNGKVVTFPAGAKPLDYLLVIVQDNV